MIAKGGREGNSHPKAECDRGRHRAPRRHPLLTIADRIDNSPPVGDAAVIEGTFLREAVPESAAIGLLAVGLAGLVLARRWRSHKVAG